MNSKKEIIIVSNQICWLNFMTQKFQHEYSVKPLFWEEWENLTPFQLSAADSCLLDQPEFLANPVRISEQ